MFSRAFFVLCSVVVLGATLASAAPQAQAHIVRQTGDLECNINRVRILGEIFLVGQTARNLTQELASDHQGSILIGVVNKALVSTEDGLADIASALFNQQPSPAAAITQVGNGISDMFDAASNITSTNAAVKENVNTLKGQLQEASFAGDKVEETCK
ncbi:hypothetical protein EUX98_g6755 [Antrodiella citrinella]|uniref:Cell wall galactomannoprotein n=1 Tax=Antrodiella citrinella TaxID=2447956 RepID=A0A4S4MN65_9APHY|nr:hypothetical protein EUX98_g6755 [Antrodiella citrinella]